MQTYRIYQKFLPFLLLAAFAFYTQAARAQPAFSLNANGANGAALGEGDRVPKLEAGITAPDANHNAQLFIIATLPDGAHTYSITQAPHGPNRTRIKVGTTSDVPGIDAFHSVDLPQIKHDEDIYPGIPLEEQYGTVKWFAPVHLAPGVKPDSIKLEGKVYMQLCDDNGCALPRDYAFTATYRPDVRAVELPKETPAAAPAAKPAAPPVNSVPPTGSPSPVASPATPLSTSSGIVRPGVTLPQLNAGFTVPKADGSAQLFITVTLPPNLYTYSITQPSGGPIATTINVDAGSDYRLIGQFLPLTSPNVEVNVNAFPGLPLEEHAGTITWVAPIKFTPGMRPTLTQIHGSVRMQLCEMNDKGCFPPRDFPFSAALSPESKELAAAAPQQSRSANNTSPRNKALKPRAAAGGGEIKWSRFTSASDLHDLVGGNFNLDAIQANVRGSEVPLSVWGAILAGFIGGLILNVMPCVLPVIGLKILSFVEQSRHNRAKAFALNVWYSAGLLTVFLVLASLAVGPQKLGWGQLFGETWFTITLTVVVFVMGLSFMGLWEVPLPAFLGSGKAGELASQEAPPGHSSRRADDTLGDSMQRRRSWRPRWFGPRRSRLG